jgi:hypothetical protein
LICVTRRVAIQFFRVFVFFIVSLTSENQTVNGTTQLLLFENNRLGES